MALLYSQKEESSIIGVWEISESLSELEKHPLLTSYIEESLSFKSKRRRREWLAVRLLLVSLLDEVKEIAYLPSGNPYLVDQSYFISISHTRGYAAVILHKTKRVSIDIEYHSERVLGIVPRFVRDDEKFYATSDNCTPLLIWSAKEVLFKLLDDTGVDFKKHLRILPFPLADSGHFIAYDYKTSNQGTAHLIQYYTTSDYVVVFCIE